MDGKADIYSRSLGIFRMLQTNILPPPEKRKRQNGGSGLRIGLHILPDGMCWRAIPIHSLCAQD
jgi:hypothetical protein